MELLISRGADIESMSKSDTPLHVAACDGKAEALKLLLDNKADVSSFSSYMHVVKCIHFCFDQFSYCIKCGHRFLGLYT